MRAVFTHVQVGDVGILIDASRVLAIDADADADVPTIDLAHIIGYQGNKDGRRCLLLEGPRPFRLLVGSSVQLVAIDATRLRMPPPLLAQLFDALALHAVVEMDGRFAYVLDLDRFPPADCR